MNEEDNNTKRVLEWLRESTKTLYENPSDDNIRDFIAEVMENKEVVINAIFNALKPEFRQMAETISGLMVPGVQGKEKEMVRADE